MEAKGALCRQGNTGKGRKQQEEYMKQSTQKNSPSKAIADFLNSLSNFKNGYDNARSTQAETDKLELDLLHELEFSKGEAEKNKIATQLRQNRIRRRECKDEVRLYRLIAEFTEDSNNKKTLNQLTQLLACFL